MLQMLKAFLIFLMISLSFGSCNKISESENTEHSKVLKYLGSEKNYQDKKQYVSYFKKNYQNYINRKEYRNAEETLAIYGDLIINKDSSDSIIYNDTLDFIKAEYPVKKDTLYANLFLVTGSLLQYRDKLDSAAICAKKAMLYSKYSPDSDVFKASKNLLGTTYSFMGEYKIAIPILIELIKTAEENGDHRFLGPLYNNLAYCYDSFYAHKEAEKFYVKAGDELLLKKDTANYLAVRANYILNNFETEMDTIKTLKLIVSTEAIFKNYKNPSEVTKANVYDIFTYKYMLKKNYDSAIYFNQLGIDYFEKSDNKQLVDNYNITGEMLYFYKYRYLKNPEKVEELANICVKDNVHQTALALYNLLYQDALKNKKYQEAIKYRDLEIKSNEILQKENADGKLFEFDKKYQIEKKEKEIAKQKSKIQKDNFYIVGLLLVLAILTLLVILYLNKLKRRKIIEEKNRNVQFIIDLLENVEVERNRIAYELHDSVNHSLLSVKNTILSKKEVKSESISNIIEEVREISRNLYPVILEKVGLEESIKSLSENFSNETTLFVTAEINYLTKVEKSKELHLYRIIQEALNNTLKHGNATITKINMTTDEKFLNLIIKDNGEGFDVNAKTKSTNSFGLQGIKQRAQAVNANLDLKSDDSGTIIQIKMPF